MAVQTADLASKSRAGFGMSYVHFNSVFIERFATIAIYYAMLLSLRAAQPRKSGRR